MSQRCGGVISLEYSPSCFSEEEKLALKFIKTIAPEAKKARPLFTKTHCTICSVDAKRKIKIQLF